MWGVAVAMPHIFVENGEWKWYNHIYKFGLCEVGTYEKKSVII